MPSRRMPSMRCTSNADRGSHRINRIVGLSLVYRSICVQQLPNNAHHLLNFVVFKIKFKLDFKPACCWMFIVGSSLDHRWMLRPLRRVGGCQTLANVICWLIIGETLLKHDRLLNAGFQLNTLFSLWFRRSKSLRIQDSDAWEASRKKLDQAKDS